MSSELKMFLQNGYKMTGDLPLHIPDKISTLEDIYYLCNLVNTAISKVDSLVGDTNDYTDIQIQNVKTILSNELENVEKELTKLSENANAYTDSEIDEISSKLKESSKKINQSISELIAENTSLNAQIIELRKLIANANMSVICPTCGVTMSIQDALYHIYNSIRVTITWAEFEEKVSSMTWDSFDEAMTGVTWTQFEYSINDVLNLNLETINLENN